MSRTRRRFTSEQKAQIVRRHLANKEPVSALAEEFGLQPSQVHTWVNTVLAGWPRCRFGRLGDEGTRGITRVSCPLSPLVALQPRRSKQCLGHPPFYCLLRGVAPVGSLWSQPVCLGTGGLRDEAFGVRTLPAATPR